MARLQLDMEHLGVSRRASESLDRTRTESAPASIDRGALIPADAPPFADVPLSDPPRVTSISSATRTSATSTPRTIQPPSLPQRTPSPAPKSKPPLSRNSSHRRQNSDASASEASLLLAQSRLDKALSVSGELQGRGSGASTSHSERMPEANGLASSSHTPVKGPGPSGVNDISAEDQRSLHDDLLMPDSSKAGSNRFVAWISRDLLLALTLLGVIIGIVTGLTLRPFGLSQESIQVAAFPGELMLRLLKMLVLPLVAGSMVAGVCALRGSTASVAKVARYTLCYYAATTITAVILGILLVNIIQPGRGDSLGKEGSSGCGGQVTEDGSSVDDQINRAPVSPLTALLGVVRNMFPENIAVAAVNMNILGIITFSLMFGLALASIGEAGDAMVNAVDVFNSCISKMVCWVLWISPLGIASLISMSIVKACDLYQTLIGLGLWVVTVLLGLALFAGIILPCILWLITRTSPLQFLRTFSKALVMAFGTSSSSAALPVAMDCAADAGCDDSIIKFVLPLGTTVNMNGTALYEATTVIFIAQAHGVALGLAGTVVVACTATLAAIGAAAIPSAGLVTMLMVLQAVSLEQFAADLAVILAVDWLLDRCRTAVNLMSDALAVVLVDSVCRRKQDYSVIEIA